MIYEKYNTSDGSIKNLAHLIINLKLISISSLEINAIRMKNKINRTCTKQSKEEN